MDGSPGRVTMYEYLSEIQNGLETPLEDLARAPAVMPEFIHIWGWFEDLNRTRDVGFQMLPIAYREMTEYFNLMRIVAHPEEIRLLAMFDQIYMSVVSENQKE